jgi:hypothetical protein
MCGITIRKYAFVLFAFSSVALAESAEQPTTERTPEYTTDQSPEEATQTAQADNKSVVDPETPEGEPNPEGTEQRTIFRPSEDISEDIVIAFPVDI